MLNIPESIKDLYKADVGARKNFRVVFPNGEMPDITNENIVQESVKFTESVCSQQYFKYGLTENPTIEFETVGIGNMYGMKIQCYNEIETTSLSAQDIADIQAMTDLDGELVLEADSDLGFGFYRVPLGVFRVESCPRSHGAMTHRQVTGYGYGLKESVFYNACLRNFTQMVNAGRARHKAFNVSAENHILALYSSLAGSVSVDTPVTPRATTSTIRQTTATIDGVDYVFKPALTREDLDDPSITSITANVYVYTVTSAFGSRQYIAKIVFNLSEDLRAVYDFIKGTTVQPLSFTRISANYFGADLGLFKIYNDVGKEELYPLPQYATPADPAYFIAQYTEIPFLGVYPVGSPEDMVVYELSDAPFEVYSAYEPYNSDMVIKIDKAFANSDVDNVALLNALLESHAELGVVNRNGDINRVHLSKNNPVSVPPSLYSSLWWDEYDVAPIGSVKYTLNADENEELVYQFGDGQSVYDMTGNEMLEYLSNPTEEKLNEYLDANFIPYIADVYYTPTECEMKGLPYIEAGDYLEIDAGDSEGSMAETFIMNRTMTGIQVLSDSIVSQGGEIIDGGYYVNESEA